MLWVLQRNLDAGHAKEAMLDAFCSLGSRYVEVSFHDGVLTPDIKTDEAIVP